MYSGIHTGRTPASDEILPEMDIVFKVTERRVAKDGTTLLFPEIEVETFWTNLYKHKVIRERLRKVIDVRIRAGCKIVNL